MLIDICILSGFLRTSTALFVAFVSGTTSFSEKIRLNGHCMFGGGRGSTPAQINRSFFHQIIIVP